jgi:hypothetical protein
VAVAAVAVEVEVVGVMATPIMDMVVVTTVMAARGVTDGKCWGDLSHGFSLCWSL